MYTAYVKNLWLVLLVCSCQTGKKKSDVAAETLSVQQTSSIANLSEKTEVLDQNEKIYLLKKNANKINAENLNISNLSVIKKKEGKSIFASVNFEMSPDAQLAEYLICPRNGKQAHQSLADCQIHIANLIPIDFFDLSPGSYEVRVRACVSPEIAKDSEVSCGPYQVSEFVQETNSGEIMQTYKLMELAMLDSLSEWASFIRQNILRYKEASSKDPACMEIPDHNEILYAAEILQQGMIVAGLYDFVNREIPLKKGINSTHLALKNTKFRDEALKKIEYREAFSFRAEITESRSLKSPDPDALKNIISQKIIENGNPQTLSLTPSFLWQMIQSVLSGYEGDVEECKARKEYNVIVNEIKNKLIGLKTNLASIRGRRETNLSTIGEQHEKN